MSEREQVVAFGHDEATAALVTLIGKTGARDLELAYDRADGPPLSDGEEPGPDDHVRWTATATFRDGTSITGQHVVEPGGSSAYGLTMAGVDLLRRLGCNVTVMDAR